MMTREREKVGSGALVLSLRCHRRQRCRGLARPFAREWLLWWLGELRSPSCVCVAVRAFQCTRCRLAAPPACTHARLSLSAFVSPRPAAPRRATPTNSRLHSAPRQERVCRFAHRPAIRGTRTTCSCSCSFHLLWPLLNRPPSPCHHGRPVPLSILRRQAHQAPSRPERWSKWAPTPYPSNGTFRRVASQQSTLSTRIDHSPSLRCTVRLATRRFTS